MSRILTVYDITSDKRRNKLHNMLKNYGIPVQYSVFEAEVTTEELAEIISKVNKIIDKKKDSVKIYFIGESHNQHIELGMDKATIETGLIFI